MPTNKLEFIITADSDGLDKVVQRAEVQLERLVQEQENLAASFKRGEISASKYASGLARVGKQVRAQKSALSSLNVEVRGLDDAFRKVGKGSAGGSAGLAIQELGRGIADFNAVGGFQDFSRGALASANNMERMVEIIGFTIKQTGGLKNAMKALGASLLGPAGVLLGITLAIQFIPKLVEGFKKWADGAKAAEDAQKDLNAEAEKGNLNAEEYLTKLQAIGRDRLAQVNKEIALTKRKIDGTALSLASEEHNIQVLKDLEAERDALIAQDDLFIQGMQNQASEIMKAAEAARAYKKRLEELRDAEDIAVFTDDSGLEADDPYLNVFAGENEEQSGTMLKNLREADNHLDMIAKRLGIFNPNEHKIVDPEVIDDEIEALEDLQSALEQTGSVMANLSDEAAMKWASANEQFEKSKNTVESASDSLISAFESAATQGGNLIQNLAGGILSAIGSMLIKEGSAYIALGIARNAAFPGSGKKVIASGAGLVAAGVGLKAAGSSVSRSGRGGGGSSSSAAAGSRPVERAGDTTSSNVVEFKIGNDALVGQMQQALDKRGTTHGSSRLFPNRSR